MKALTVQQPWAWAIVHGEKDVENRTQLWSHRGELAIHAGKQVSRDGVNDPRLRPEWAVAMGYVHVADDRAEISYPQRGLTQEPNRLAAALPLGAIVGLVDVVDMHRAWTDDGGPCCDSLWAEMPYVVEQDGLERITHLVVERPRPLAEPVPCRGALGLWTVPAGVDDQVLAQLEAVA